MTSFDYGFWKTRAQRYDSLDWVNRKGYLERFVEAGRFGASDRVLDVGTGSGVVAFAVAPLVREVVGIDPSPEMLRLAIAKNGHVNAKFELGDARELKYEDGVFDKVTARMVYHHILEGGEAGVRECARVLKRGGIFVLSEGVPPCPELRDWYQEMFSYKEERRTFLDQDLLALAGAGAFAKVRHVVHVSKRVSIGNWLDNSGIPDENKRKIVDMHLALDDFGKRIYNMDITAGDIFIDMKFVIVAATK
jgi:ubiquinone/menaquinone biosynthesis C-methylase UbiE